MGNLISRSNFLSLFKFWPAPLIQKTINSLEVAFHMLRIVPPKEIQGEVIAPPSKSYTHRGYFLSLLADEKSIVERPPISDDTLATIDAIRAFGADLIEEVVYPPEELRPNYIFARDSGTTARISIIVSSLAKGVSVIDGREQLRRRPMEDGVSSLRMIGVEAIGKRLPVKVFGRGRISAKEVSIVAEKSSQFATGFLILAAKIGLKVEIVKPVSKPYIEMTLKTMEEFGVKYDKAQENERLVIFVDPGVKGTKFKVPGDYSSAANFLVAGALYGKIRVRNLMRDDVQADKEILNILREYGAKVKVKDEYVEVESNERNPLNVDCSNFPDLFPLLAVLAAYAEGKSVIRGRQLRIKESDRIHAMAVNLSRAGIRVRELSDGLEIWGGQPKGFRGKTFNDHRITMALAILALGAKGESIIPETKSIAKSYPNFFEDLMRVIK